MDKNSRDKPPMVRGRVRVGKRKPVGLGVGWRTVTVRPGCEWIFRKHGTVISHLDMFRRRVI